VQATAHGVHRRDDGLMLCAEDLLVGTRGYDLWEEVKAAAARRWVDAVNAEGSYGRWAFALVRKTTDVADAVSNVSHRSAGARTNDARTLS
jgi:hypothetical protein